MQNIRRSTARVDLLVSAYRSFENAAASRPIVLVTAAVLMTVTGLAVWRSRNNPNSLDLCMIVTLPLVYLIAPFSYLQHLVYLLPSIIFLVFSRGRPDKTLNVLLYCLLALTVLTMALPKTLPLDFYAVFTLWLLAAFALLSNKSNFARGLDMSSGISTIA